METRKRQYSWIGKVIVITMQVLFSLILTSSTIVLSTCFKNNMLKMSDLSKTSFGDSGFFESEFSQKVSGLLEYVTLKQKYESNGKYDKTLPSTKWAIKHNVKGIDNYRRYLNEFDTGSSNMYYYIEDTSTGLHYTNMKNVKSDEEAYTKATAYGHYLTYDAATMNFDSNIGGSRKDYYKDISRYDLIDTGNLVLVVAVDNSFSKMDGFRTAKLEYEKVQPWARMALIGLVVGTVGWLICFAFMTVVVGRCADRETIKTLLFDKIPSEALIVLLLISIKTFAQNLSSIRLKDFDVIGRIVTSGTLGIVGTVLVMFFYLSLVRKIKAENFINGSILYFVIKNIRFVILTKKRDALIWGRMFFFIGSIVVLAFFAFYSGYIWSYISLGLVLIACLGYYSKKIVQLRKIVEGLDRIRDGQLDYKYDLSEYNGLEKILGEKINEIGTGLKKAVEESVRDEQLKANMITNVSHDIKTPLTSIINYTTLLKREQIDNPHAVEYIEVLEKKSMRLKRLMEDLVETSRISSGNVQLKMTQLDFVELVRQTGGEYNERFDENHLSVVSKFPNHPVYIQADGQQLWRVIGNLYNNAAKYAMPNTRVRVEITQEEDQAVFMIKNISAAVLNVPTDQLTERFVRGDASRSTQGHGLGLSIAKMLVDLMDGSFVIEVEDDLFIVKVGFSCEKT